MRESRWNLQSAADTTAATTAQLHLLLVTLVHTVSIAIFDDIDQKEESYRLLRDNVGVGGGGSRASGLLHGEVVGVPGVLMGVLRLLSGRLEEVEVEHGEIGLGSSDEEVGGVRGRDLKEE